MAKKDKKPAPDASAKPKSGNTYVISVMTLLVLGLAVFATPALLVLAVGMVPSLVAWVIDREPGHNATIAVTAMNFTGVAPFVAEILMVGATTTRAMTMVTDVFVLAVMYGAAAVGWALVATMPKVAAIYISVRNEGRIQAMLRERKRLVEDWGEEVKEAPPPKKRRSAGKRGAGAAEAA